MLSQINAQAEAMLGAATEEADNIWVASANNDREAIDRFLGEGFTVVSKDENGYTPLHAATAWGHRELLEWFLTLPEADINVVDSDGDSLLHHCETVEMARFLVNKGANREMKNEEGQTAKEVAESEENEELADYLSSLEVMAEAA